MKIYTKTGDAGQTALFGGRRVGKDHLRIDAYGTVDELNAFLGIVHDSTSEARVRRLINTIQHRLFTVGASLASDPEKKAAPVDLTADDVQLLEASIDELEADLPPLRNFILPAGHPVVSHCHVARTVCRRAERLIVALGREEPVEERVLAYMNRLSDLLFVLARYLGHQLGAEEVTWTGRQ